MLLTEELAATKTCCGPSNCGFVNISSMREVGRPEKHRTCQGSTCMAWRWGTVSRGGDDGEQIIQKGYCGLAAWSLTKNHL